MSMSDKSEQVVDPLFTPALAKIYFDNHVEGIEQHLLACIERGCKQEERYIRLNPRFLVDETLAQLSNELGGAIPKAVVVPFMRGYGFYSIPGTFSLHNSKAYAEGKIYGMDLSSGAAVAALDLINLQTKLQNDAHTTSNKYNVDSIQEQKSFKPLHVLDLCCCPGLKLCTIADTLESSNYDTQSQIVGVDICPTRLQVCKKILRKYHFDRVTSGRKEGMSTTKIRLFCADGTSFGNEGGSDEHLVFDSIAEMQEQHGSKSGKRKRMNKSARAREKKRLKAIESTTLRSCNEDRVLFDRVLVDAECSTDGSTKHLLEKVKKRQLGIEPGKGLSTKLIDENHGCLDKLHKLQRDLIVQGFKSLKVNGSMVYSTCSLSRYQNEDIVAHLLGKFANAYIIPFTEIETFNLEGMADISDGGSLRFLPTGNCGGFFLVKIGKAIDIGL